MFQVIYCPNNDDSRDGSDVVELFTTESFMKATDYAYNVAAQIVDVTFDWVVNCDHDHESPFDVLWFNNGESVQIISAD